MKRNLYKGIIFISAIALSSCSTMDNLSKSDPMGDDVYYTKAKAGDEFDYVAQYNQQQNAQVRNDDYYYYGDYESRINRFSYYTPFNYQDDFYYGHTSYTSAQYYSPAIQSTYNYGYNPFYDFGVYSAFDFGFGYYGGYDNYGYGNAYSSYIYGGGNSHHGRGSSRWGNAGGGTGLTFTGANAAYPLSRYIGNNPGSNSATGNGPTFVRANGNQWNSLYSNSRPGGANAVYPGRPGSNSITQPSSTNTTTRILRPQSENPRPVVQQPTFERPAPVQAAPASSNSGSSSSGSSSSSGGGGRPVRP
jgi:hypothetical protein